MSQWKRALLVHIQHTLSRQKSVLLLGPRQTGKTSLTKELSADRIMSFMDGRLYTRYLRDPGALIPETQALAKELGRPPLIVLDEIQKVPGIMDAVQILIDDKIAQFVLTGSSARRLYNLLPGRVIVHHLDPISLPEMGESLPEIETLLYFGSLPGILSITTLQDREQELESYVQIYLEEEIRKEALVRNLSAFSKFLQLACIESGQTVSFRNLSQEIGIAHTTIAEYYRILESCMIVERFEPLTVSAGRKRLNKSPKYCIFDMGIRRVGAMEGLSLPKETLGKLFEQWVGLTLRHMSRDTKDTRISFWRDHAGPEVDWVILQPKRYVPIEVKWTETPTLADARHLHHFLDLYPDEASKGYIVCRTPFAMALSNRVTAIPWQTLGTVLGGLPFG
jgi:predicted AAA+ superfamily ATPase